MTNEHTLMVETDIPVNMTVADGTGIERGAVLMMTDPNTAATSTGNADVVAGIAANEKIASNGVTSIAVYKGGQFKGLAGGAITVGDALITNSGVLANELITAGVNAENIVGYALETVADTETFMYKLNPSTINVA